MDPLNEELKSRLSVSSVGRRDVLKGLAVLAITPVLSQSSSVAQEPRSNQAEPLPGAVAGNRNQSFDEGWRFLRGNATGAEAPGFDDSAWRTLNLPHDWSVETLPPRGAEENGEGALWGLSVLPTRVGPFDTELSQGGRDTGWFVGGTGWYRRRFSAAGVPADGQVEITFDGVYKDSDVWLNGTLLGTHPYGYTTFSYDLTPHLKRDGDNVLAVRVRNEGKNSRWYSGSGMYRHVWLDTTGKLRVPKWGIFVTTPDASKNRATVNVAVKVENRMETEQDMTVRIRLFDSNNVNVATHAANQSVSPAAVAEVEQQVELSNPKLWSGASPQMYRAEIDLMVGAHIADHLTTPFAIRKTEVDAQYGLRINGEVAKLKGGCVHHDNGLLGACAFDRADERRVELMKANGFNAIRTSHNPPSPAFLDACDRLGMLVMEEAFDQWETQKNPEDYHLDFAEWWQRDLSSMILRDRNHPSVIMWSIGNEIPERAQPRGVEIAKELSEYAKKLDPTRPITAAINNSRGGGEALDPAFEHLDICGYNYMVNNYEPDHARHPQRVILGTESFPQQAFQSWAPVEKLPYVIGDFVWTGMDYLGESSLGNAQLETPGRGGAGGFGGAAVRPAATQQAQAAGAFVGGGVVPSQQSATAGAFAGGAAPTPQPRATAPGGRPNTGGFPGGGSSISLPFPWFNSNCGDVDLIGDTKPQGYYRRVLWGMSKLEMMVQRPVPAGRIETISAWGWSDELRSWTWPGYEGRTIKVRVASSGDQVRLFLNGNEIDTKPVSRETEFKAEFDVPYASGELKTIAMLNGRQIAELDFKTVGKPAKLRLQADRSSIRRGRNDLSYVKLEVLDQAGDFVPDAVVPVTFTVTGAGDLVAAGTANPKDAVSFRSRSPNTYHGRSLAIVQPKGKPGKILVKAQAPGMEDAFVQLEVL